MFTNQIKKEKKSVESSYYTSKCHILVCFNSYTIVDKMEILSVYFAFVKLAAIISSNMDNC